MILDATAIWATKITLEKIYWLQLTQKKNIYVSVSNTAIIKPIASGHTAFQAHNNLCKEGIHHKAGQPEALTSVILEEPREM